MRLFDIPMGENDVNAKTVGEFLKSLLLHLWTEAAGFDSKRPFGNSDWQYQVYASLIKAGYDIGRLDEYGDVDDVDYAKADKLIIDAIDAEFAEPVKHGRWKWNVDEFYMGLTTVTCSLCREEWVFEDITDVESLNYHHCPNCGARMDLED